ncbi:uncharacterized protein LOC124843670 [Vigna umbellata]|uniref:uncharacterized protein LOC124843670 n=1 Tax=Vigna umbellata TaxID=87088 RepID=UPI001F5F40DE|nr:uncharacterized protein LOC124843670 [Vigna umbellata]
MMAFGTRVCLLFLLLTSAVMCSAIHNPKVDLSSQYEVDDYPGTGANPKHEPPPPPSFGKMQINEDDFEVTKPIL